MGKKSRAKQKIRPSQPLATIGHSTVHASQTLADQPVSNKERFLLWLVRICLALALFAPLVVSQAFYFPFVGPKSLYFMALAEIIIFSWLCLMLYWPKYRPKFNAITIALLAFFVIMVVSSLLGANPSYSFWSKFERMTGILMWVHLIGFFLAISNIFKTAKEWQKIFIVSLAAALIVALISLNGQGPSSRGGSTIGNSSFMGTYLLFNIFLACYLFFKAPWLKKSKEIFTKGAYGVIAILLFLPIFRESARASTFAVFGGIGLLAILFLAFKTKQNYLRWLGKALLVLSAIFVLAFGFIFFWPDGPLQIGFMQKFVQKATQARGVVYQTAWQGIKEKPVLGWGQEGFEFVFTRHFNSCMFLSECGGEIWFDRAHNIVYDTLIAQGFVGLTFYILIFAVCLFLLWKRFLKDKKIDFLTCALPTVILGAYFVQNLTVFDMISSYLMFFLTISFIAVVVNQQEEKPSRALAKSRLKTNPWFVAVLLFLLIVSLTEFVIQPALADHYVISALKSPDPQMRLDYYQKAFEASPSGIFQTREFLAQNSQTSIEKIIDQEQNSLTQPVAQNIIQELDITIEQMEKSRLESPYDFRSAMRLAQLYSIYSFFDKSKVSLAEEIANQTIILSPTNQQGYWTLAQALARQEKYSQALAQAEKAIALEPKWLQSYQIALQVAGFDNNKEKQQEIYQSAIKVAPHWQAELEKQLIK